MASLRLVVTENEPSTLLKDFSAFIHGLIECSPILTPVNEFISPEALYELNKKMTHPISGIAPLADQRSYPMLHLFYHLALAGKLFQKSLGKENRFFLKQTARVQLYEGLKPAEKYFFLLETLWTDVNWDKLQDASRGEFQFRVPLALSALSEMRPGKEVSLKESGGGKFDYPLVFGSLSNILLYFSYFGFWEIKPDEESAKLGASKRYFFAKSMTPSLLGVTVAPILLEARPPALWNLPSRREAGELKAKPGSPLPADSMHRSFKRELLLGVGKPKAGFKMDKGKAGEPFFLPFAPLFGDGELQRTLPREEMGLVDGTYVFKVSLRGGLWRRIEISAHDTLLNLHRSIQEAFEFDNDHLYAFFMDGKRWSREMFTSPSDEEGPHVDQVRIGELGLYVGQKILYLFDFGDEWRFQVRLEDIRMESPRPSKPKIVEKKGKAPEQYG